MPQFSHHIPITQSDMALHRMSQFSLPVGVIGAEGNYSWGYNGDCYYVTEGVLDHLVTTIKLSLDEAKQLFTALGFVCLSEVPVKVISDGIRVARKQYFSHDNLMWFLVDHIEDSANNSKLVS